MRLLRGRSHKTAHHRRRSCSCPPCTGPRVTQDPQPGRSLAPTVLLPSWSRSLGTGSGGQASTAALRPCSGPPSRGAPSASRYTSGCCAGCLTQAEWTGIALRLRLLAPAQQWVGCRPQPRPRCRTCVRRRRGLLRGGAVQRARYDCANKVVPRSQPGYPPVSQHAARRAVGVSRRGCSWSLQGVDMYSTCVCDSVCMHACT